MQTKSIPYFNSAQNNAYFVLKWKMRYFYSLYHHQSIIFSVQLIAFSYLERNPQFCFTKVIFRPIKRLNKSEIGFPRGPRRGAFYLPKWNKGNGFLLKGCSDWELDSTIALEMTDLLDDISVY